MSSKKEKIFLYFSGNLKALRKGKGVTQKRLAQVVGVRQPTIQAWESGKSGPEIDQSIDLADYFRLETVDELIRPVPSRNESRVVPNDVLLAIADDAEAILAKTHQVLHEPNWPKGKAPDRKAKKAKKPKTSR